mmetsp:Transcript_22477/g.42106  ORF Transcript_22477/g.42106 Transcript_22477/m.42106 type:complete len:95 (-) Transcript_22477:330-614(-)
MVRYFCATRAFQPVDGAVLAVLSTLVLIYQRHALELRIYGRSTRAVAADTASGRLVFPRLWPNQRTTTCLRNERTIATGGSASLALALPLDEAS